MASARERPLGVTLKVAAASPASRARRSSSDGDGNPISGLGGAAAAGGTIQPRRQFHGQHPAHDVAVPHPPLVAVRPPEVGDRRPVKPQVAVVRRDDGHHEPVGLVTLATGPIHATAVPADSGEPLDEAETSTAGPMESSQP